MIRRFLLFLIVLVSTIFISGKSVAQNFEWLANTKSTYSEYFSKTVLDKSGNSYSIGGFQNFLHFNNDSTRYTNEDNSTFITKYDKDGKMIWLRSFTRGQFRFLVIDSLDNLLIYGDTRDTFNSTIGTINSTSNQTIGFLFKVNSMGQPLLIKNIGLNSGVSILNMKMDVLENVFLVGSFTNNFYIDGFLVTKIGPAINTVDGFIAKFTNNSNLISWVRKASNCIFSEVSIDEMENQYITGTLSGSIPYNVSVFGGITINAIKNDVFITKIDANGVFKWAKRIGGPNQDQGSSVFYNNGKVYIIGHVIGNVKFDTISASSSPVNIQNGFIAIFDTIGEITKFNLFKGNSIVFNFYINIFSEILLIGIFSSKMTIDNFSIQSSNSNTIFLCKMDEDINVLWLLNINSTGDANNVISSINREYYFSGNLYTNYIQFGPFYRDLNFVSNNGFLVKISDISITLLPPSKRNFCSSDSLYLAYITTGKFKQGNKFEVQLSDNSGGFDSLSIIIGTRQDTISNTIACKLPSNIIGSSKYRFRIIADSPAVVSFYDTVLYHIEPIPIAKAGSDTFVCFGRTIQLGSGLSTASTYIWQPGLLFLDSSTKLATLKNGISPGIYNFTLKASNQHCMSWDTAKVEFLPALNINLSSDTILCRNTIASIKPVLSGGKDSNNYSITWYRNSFSTTLGSGKTIVVPTDTTNNIFAILNDGCSIADTASTSIHISTYRKLLIPSDTFLCSGKSLCLSPKNYRPDTIGYQLKWLDENWNLKTNFDNLNENYLKSTARYLISQNICKVAADTASLKIQVAPALGLKLRKDTTLCFGTGFYLKGIAKGGDSTKYNLSWNNSVPDALNLWTYNNLSGESEFQRYFQLNKDTLLQAKLTDQCSLNTPIDSVFISVLPKLQVQTPTLPRVCEGSSLNLVGNAVSGKQPYQFAWVNPLNLNVISTKDTLFIASAQMGSYWLTVSDQCYNRDSILLQLNPEIRPNASFNVLDSLLCAEDIGIIDNTSNNSQMLPMNFNWQWQNGSSTAQTPLPKFSNPGSYNLKLIVTLANTCSDTFIKQNAFTVNPKPKANFSADKTIVSKSDALIQFKNISLTQGLSSYLWNFGDGKFSIETEPQNLFEQAGWYSISLLVTNEFGCIDSMSKYHLIWVQGGKSIFMPNAITLNNDGLNEDFKPYGEDVKNWQIEVYDRTGNEVFAGNENTGGFKGLDRNSIPLSAGVYVYKVEVSTIDNEILYFKGIVTLLR